MDEYIYFVINGLYFVWFGRAVVLVNLGNNVLEDLVPGLPPLQLLVQSSLPPSRFILMESQMSYKNPNNTDLFPHIFFRHYRTSCKLIKGEKCVIMRLLFPFPSEQHKTFITVDKKLNYLKKATDLTGHE